MCKSPTQRQSPPSDLLPLPVLLWPHHRLVSLLQVPRGEAAPAPAEESQRGFSHLKCLRSAQRHRPRRHGAAASAHNQHEVQRLAAWWQHGTSKMTMNPCEFVYIDVLFIQLIGLTAIKPVCLPHNVCVQVLYFVCILFFNLSLCGTICIISSNV